MLRFSPKGSCALAGQRGRIVVPLIEASDVEADSQETRKALAGLLDLSGERLRIKTAAQETISTDASKRPYRNRPPRFQHIPTPGGTNPSGGRKGTGRHLRQAIAHQKAVQETISHRCLETAIPEPASGDFNVFRHREARIRAAVAKAPADLSAKLLRIKRPHRKRFPTDASKQPYRNRPPRFQHIPTPGGTNPSGGRKGAG